MTDSALFEQTLLKKLRNLPVEKQQEALDFVEFLERKRGGSTPRRSLKGLWSDLKIDIGEEEISSLRRELWADFPRADI